MPVVPREDTGRRRAFTLLAATQADVALARRVAVTLERGGARKVCILTSDVAGRPCDAIVSSGSAATLHDIVSDLAHAGNVAGGPRRSFPWALVHPHPENAHYAVAREAGIDEIIAWPAEEARWSAVAARRGRASEPPVAEQGPERELPGNSAAIKRLREQIGRAAAYDANVLLVGESGAGKEYAAQALHRLSRRRQMPLVVLNCAALPENLIESDLFGYERGAFTNAHASYPGKFALAEGGTLFLDEIGDMPAAVQAKILRVIEGHEYYRIGATRPVRANVRLVAATHRDLDQLCDRGDFRRDLYFRLNVARLELPPLRERGSDVDLLARRFLRELSDTMARPRIALGAQAAQALRAYAWPGNLRELHNALESAIIQAATDTIGLPDLPSHIVRWLERCVAPADERSRLESTLRETHWNKSEAARTLHWSRVKLYRKLREYHLHDPDAPTVDSPL